MFNHIQQLSVFVSGAVIASIAGLATPAHADSVTLEYRNARIGYKHKVFLGDTVRNNVFTGERRYDWCDATGAAESSNGCMAGMFSLEPFLSVPNPSGRFDIAPLSTLSVQLPGGSTMSIDPRRADMVANVIAYRTGFNSMPFVDSADRRSFTSAMQFVIWEAIYEPGIFDDVDPTRFDINSGHFRATRTTNDDILGKRMRNYFDQIAQAAQSGPGYSGDALASGDYQSQIGVLIPLPSAAALGLVGLAVVASTRRR